MLPSKSYIQIFMIEKIQHISSMFDYCKQYTCLPPLAKNDFKQLLIMCTKDVYSQINNTLYR